MDTNAAKTRVATSFAEWQSLSPEQAARELHRRVQALPANLRRAAVAWLRPESGLAVEIAALRGSDGDGSPMGGIPYALKDLFDIAGVPTYAGSTFLPGIRPTPTVESRLVTRLRELGGAVAAKTHLVEFASGLTGENPHYGDCPHPLFPDRLTGGSSSGSAALVTAGVVPFAVGSDTGGSVRVPGSWGGLYGFRLTPGDEFIRDAFPLSATLDTAGWFTANAADMLAVWNGITGGAGRGPTPRGCYVPMPAMIDVYDPETAAAYEAAASRLCPVAPHDVQETMLNSWRSARDAYSTISMTEAHALHRNWLEPFRERYDQTIWRRYTDAGTWPSERVEAAREVFAQVRADWTRYFDTYDFLVLPAVPCPAPRKADCTMEHRISVLTLTAPASVGGLPCLTIPVGLPNGMSAGMQVVLPAATSRVVPHLLKR